MKPGKSILWMLAGIGFIFSCNGTDPEPGITGRYEHGVFIVNEGNFSDSDGSLSFYDLDSQKVHQKVFEQANSRPFAGILQSLTFFEQKGYLIDQLGRIEIVNQADLQSVRSVLTGLEIPRWFVAHGNLGYVSDWGPYDENYSSPDSRIRIFDLGDMSLKSEIATEPKPEGMIIIDDKLYVANSEVNVVSVYDLTDNALTGVIEVPYGPDQFVTDSYGDLWVVCTGAFVSTGAIAGINTTSDEVFTTIDLADKTPNGKISINGDGDLLFFMSEEWAPDYSFAQNTVYKINLSDNGTEPATAGDPIPVVTGKNWYGLGVDPVMDLLYIADAQSFQGNGTIYRYRFDGSLLDEFTSGRGPAYFVFLDNN